MINFKSLIINLVISLGTGILSALITRNSMDNYKKLNLPKLAPPSILFPIVWTILYLLMGISYFIFKNSSNKDDNLISYVYYIQLFINAFWSIVFFIFNWYLFSILWIILLDIFVILLIRLFSKNNKISAYLNIPYLIWILFATYLTLGIYILN